MATRIQVLTQSCDKVADCGEPAEWRYEDGAQLCVYHAQERDGTLPPTVADLQAQLQQAQEERDNAFGWAEATNQRSLRVLEDARRSAAERDAAIEREGEQRRRRIEAERRVRELEVLAEVRLIAGCWLWKVIATGVVGIGAKPIITPAEAQEEDKDVTLAPIIPVTTNVRVRAKVVDWIPPPPAQPTGRQAR